MHLYAHTTATYVSAYYYYICVLTLVHVRALVCMHLPRGFARQVDYYIMRAHTTATYVSAYYYYICPHPSTYACREAPRANMY
jgi:hypothetical protein